MLNIKYATNELVNFIKSMSDINFDQQLTVQYYAHFLASHSDLKNTMNMPDSSFKYYHECLLLTVFAKAGIINTDVLTKEDAKKVLALAKTKQLI